MAFLYSVRDWSDHYENNRTREIKQMAWVPIPIKFDGDGYTELVAHPKGAAYYGAWIAILGVAARCDTRGTLLRDGGRPHDAGTLSRITRLPKDLLQDALDRLVEIGWLERKSLQDNDPAGACDNPAGRCGETAATSQAGAEGTEQNRTEGTEQKGRKGTEQKNRSDVDLSHPIVLAWNEVGVKAGLSRVVALSPKRRKALAEAISEEPDPARWRMAIIALGRSPWHRGENERRWKADIDFLLQPDQRAKWLDKGATISEHPCAADEACERPATWHQIGLWYCDLHRDPWAGNDAAPAPAPVEADKTGGTA